MTSVKTAVIVGISSDIGAALAHRYVHDGYRVIGTYRHRALSQGLKKLGDSCISIRCDVSDPASVRGFLARCKSMRVRWDEAVFSVGTQEPVGGFFSVDFGSWSSSVGVNSIGQLRVLHGLYPLRRAGGVSAAVFFAGCGTNNAVKDLSAYAVSKIMLIKMCELLDYENGDLNVFILGPGWVRTKIHDEIMRYGKKAGNAYKRTKEFLESGAGTGMDEIYDCIRFFVKQGKRVSSGRNFSIVNDAWRGPETRRLIRALKRDPDMYKLRRFRNDFQTR